MNGTQDPRQHRQDPSLSCPQKRLLVIVPAFNEESNIVETVAEIRQVLPQAGLIVVDDGSIDATAEAARRAGARVVRLPFHLGIGAAVQTGFLVALKDGYSYAVQIDADGQHDPKDASLLLDSLLTTGADICIGSRFLNRQGYQSSVWRRCGIRFFSWLIHGLTGCWVTDATSGLRVFGPRAIQLFATEYPADFPEPESIVIAARAGLRVAERPASMRPRRKGHSSIRRGWVVYYMLKVTFAILLDCLKPIRKDWR